LQVQRLILARPERLELPTYWFEVPLLTFHLLPPRRILFGLRFLAVLKCPLFPQISLALVVKLVVNEIRQLSLKYQEKMILRALNSEARGARSRTAQPIQTLPPNPADVAGLPTD
jgi:hypothetical protein